MITKLAGMLLGLLLVMGSLEGYAQVTIGSTSETVDAALLEIKTKDTANPIKVNSIENITSDEGGLVLPRVWLTNRTTLEPFIHITDDDWKNAATTKIKEKHVGLTVYNINNSSASSSVTNLDEIFNQGVYLWDGAQWIQVGDSRVGERYFHMPAFNLPMKKTGPATYNLYDEYKKRFTNDGSNVHFVSSVAIDRIPSPGYDRLYLASELDFVVTYYDNSVLTISSIDATGEMSYNVIDTDPGMNSFINIVLVIK